MKIVFVSNFFNHHQKPFSEELYLKLGKDYCFIETEDLPDERKKLGYGMEEIPTYVFYANENSQAKAKAVQIINEADIVIAGSAPVEYIRRRVYNNKIVIRYSERPLKVRFEITKYVGRLIKWHINYPQHKSLYLLCASAFASSDYSKFGLFKNKAYKWGYFPETIKYDSMKELLLNKNKKTILWVGRMLDWKHPDDVIEVARKLREDHLEFKVQYIGIGQMLPQLVAKVVEYQLQDYVEFLGSMKPEKVRKYMEKSGIYLFTSDRKEGWGAVLNEAMNSGCAVVANHEIGAVPYLLSDGGNGLVYESGNIDMLYKKVKYLLQNPTEQNKYGKAAYETIINEWNAEVAADRFLKLCEKLLNNEPVNNLFETGPCSQAELMNDKRRRK